jgi:uncharacterized protein (TIGR02598 family)
MKAVMRTGRGKVESRSPVAGFSLIEVTISIAITAVALVALMGMLPAGMKTMREATDRAVETRIHQQVLGEIQLAEWENRFKFDYRAPGGSAVHFYDDQGIEIFNTGPDALSGEDFAFKHVYTARVSVPKEKADKLPKSISGETYEGVFVPGETNPDPNLQLVIVEITSVHDPAFEGAGGFDDDQFLKTIHTFQATITKMGNNF